MRTKWTITSAKELFLAHNLILDETEYVSCNIKMNCHDRDGNKFFVSLSDVKTNRKPYCYSSSNPYVLENINTYFKNNNSKTRVVSEEYVDNKTLLGFCCECGKLFTSNLNNLISNNKLYCNFCSKSKRYDGLKDYTQIINNECISRSYKLITPYINRSSEEFEYICNKHEKEGIQKSNYDRLINRGQGCRYCGIESRNEKNKTDQEIFIAMAEEKGFEFIGCDYPVRTSGNSKARLHLICKKHRDKGIQYFTYDNLSRNKKGCRYCSGYDRTKEELQKEIDDLGLDISIIDYKSYSELRCRCNKCGHEWNNKGVNLTQGHACPMCKSSKGERAIRDCLKKWNINYSYQYIFEDCIDKSYLPFDFYLDDNILIEYDGIQHYKPIDFDGKGEEDALRNFELTRKHDNIKTEYCKKNNYILIRIPYWEFENGNLEQYLYQKLIFIYNTII